MRIALVTYSLGGGGAERVLAALANFFSARHQVTVITIAGPTTDRYRLNPQVNRVALNLPREKTLLGRLLSTVRRVLAVRRCVKSRQPDVIVSFMITVNVLVALSTLGLRLPIVLSERSDPQAAPHKRGWRLLRRIAYRRADAVVVLTHSARDWAETFLPAESVFVIPNPVGVEVKAIAAPSRLRSGRQVVAMGRLTRQKGFDILIAAFSQVLTRFPDWRLTIFGEGEDRSQLENQIRELGLDGRVSLPGYAEDTVTALSNGDLFVLSSRWEGFPNVLIEAMACGLPVIAADCPSGPGEIITHDFDGVLVPPQDPHALAGTMSHLMGNFNKRASLANRARQIADRLSLESIGIAWERLLITLSTNRESHKASG